MFNKYIKIVIAIAVFALSIQQFVDGAVGSTSIFEKFFKFYIIIFLQGL